MRKHLNYLTLFVALFVLANVLVSCAHNEKSTIDYNETGIIALQHEMEKGDLKAKDIAQYYLDQINTLDGKLNAVIEINPDALTIAEELDQERAAGNVRSSLHGIPVLLKDNIDTADTMLTTAGSLALVDAPKPKQDAFIVTQLRNAGAVILGKTNLSEWANFRSSQSSSGWSSRGGQTHNPYVLDRTPCGSSSGSAVAVAANLTVVAVGTETDGSIICPASNNNIVGIKPTLGLVSRSGIIPIAHSQDTAGPMGRTVSDAVILLNALVGHDESDNAPLQPQTIPNDYTKYLLINGAQGKRIGVIRQYFGRNSRVDELLEKQLQLLSEAGAEIVDVEIPTLRDLGGPELEVLLFEFKADLNSYLRERGSKVDGLASLIEFNNINSDTVMPYFGQDLVEQANAKGDLNEQDYLQALADSKRLSGPEGIDAVMEKFELDALVAPSNGPAWPIDLVNGDSPSGYVSSSSLAAISGYPSITVPVGFIQELPIGMSFIGSAYSEPVLIAIAYDFEQRSKARRAPGFITSFESYLRQ